MARLMFLSKSFINCLPFVLYAFSRLVTTFRVLFPSEKGTTIFSNLFLGFSYTFFMTGNDREAFISPFF